jgi:hypothetical protein
MADNGTAPSHLGFVEMFAGVGGFRLGLERTGWRAAWSNQYAKRCHDGAGWTAGHVIREQVAVKVAWV